MKTNENSIRVYAVNNRNYEGFNIFLEFSGQTEFLMFHRHNGLLYNLLKDGKTIGDLRRLVPQKYLCLGSNPRSNGRKKVENLKRSLNHVNRVIDEYLEYRQKTLAA